MEYFSHLCKVKATGLYLITALLLVLPSVICAQHEEYSGSDYTPENLISGSERYPRFFFTLSAGVGIPQGSFSNMTEFRDSPSGFALPGVTVGSEFNYHLDSYVGVTARYRYSRFEHDETAISADLTHYKVGEFDAKVRPWSFHTVALGPHISFNNDVSFVNLFIMPGVTFTKLPAANLHSEVAYHGNEFEIVGPDPSATAFTFVLGASFKYAFNDRLGMHMGADYSVGRFQFNGLEYETRNAAYNPRFEQHLSIVYSALSAEAGIFYYIAK